MLPLKYPKLGHGIVSDENFPRKGLGSVCLLDKNGLSRPESMTVFSPRGQHLTLNGQK